MDVKKLFLRLNFNQPKYKNVALKIMMDYFFLNVNLTI